MPLLFNQVNILLKLLLQIDFTANITSNLIMLYKLHFINFDQFIIIEDPFTYPLKSLKIQGS